MPTWLIKLGAKFCPVRKYFHNHMTRAELPIAVEIKNAEDIDINFQQYWFGIKRRWLAASFIAGAFFAIGTVATVALSRTQYIAAGKILVKPDESATLTGLVTDTKSQLTPLTLQGNPLKTEIEIILSQPVLRRVIGSLSLADNQGKPMTAEDLKKRVEVKEVKGTDIVEISYRHIDRKKAASVVNQIMRAYIYNNKMVNRSEALAARKFITQQLPETQESVRQAEQALRRFQEKNKVVVIEQEAKLSLESVEKLKALIAEAQAKFADVNAQYTALRSQLGMDSQEAMMVGQLSQSTPVQATLIAIQKTEEQLALERTRLQDTNPVVLDLSDKLVALKTQLKERIIREVGTIPKLPEKNLRAGEIETSLIKKLMELQNQRLGLNDQITSLNNNLSDYRQRINLLPKLKEEEKELQRKVEAAQVTYETLLKKLQEVEASRNQNIVNARVIEEALEPQLPALDQRSILLLAGNGIISLIIFVISVIVLERKDVSLKTVQEIQKIFNYGLLAAIPQLGGNKKNRNVVRRPLNGYDNSGLPYIAMPILEASNSPVSEVYRMLQANLDFSDKKPKVIVISSSVPQEGKSTVAANLALVYAELRKKVLLIDADMRHPSQHHAWSVTNEIGLSNVIVGRSEKIQAIQEVMPYLNVMTSGSIPPNPVTLLASQAMNTLLTEEAKNYDCIIIDAPPILMAADALVLGKIVDGILIVSRPGVVDSSSAVATKNLLQQSGLNVLGLVANGVILENESDSYFHFKKHYVFENTSNSRAKSLSVQKG